MVVLVFVVGCRLLLVRIEEMRDKRLSLQQAANSLQAGNHFTNVQASDNFKNLFEVPVLFYALCAVAINVSVVPQWLVSGGWVFVVLRGIHSFIQCTYNNVGHRFLAFFSSFLLIVALWVGLLVYLLETNVQF
jgi:hypothetical protein